MRKTVFAVLEIRDEAEILRGLDRGELETRVLQGERAPQPRPTSAASCGSPRAEADALRQSADARAQHDHACAASATVLAAQLAATRQGLEADNARYEKWSAESRSTREAAGKAKAELQRRGNRQPEEGLRPQPNDRAQIIARLCHDLGADIEAPKHPVVPHHQAVIDAGEPWAPQRAPEPNPLSAHEPDPETSSEDESVPCADQAKRPGGAAGRPFGWNGGTQHKHCGLGAHGRTVEITADPDGTVWVGGAATACIRGSTHPGTNSGGGRRPDP